MTIETPKMPYHPFQQPLQEYVFYSVYSRWSQQHQRRESWTESVERSVQYLVELAPPIQREPATALDRGVHEGSSIPPSLESILFDAIHGLEIMPSMRLLATAGVAARRSNILIYNCSAMGIDTIDAFVETLILSMSGCGVGYSVEHQFIQHLPTVAYQNGIRRYHRVEDSMEGWAEALRDALLAWWMGEDIICDTSDIRPAGSPLKTKGGYASGPEPFDHMINKIRAIMHNAQGRKLTSLEIHDMMCHIGQAAVSGGYRRTAMIALADCTDEDMLTCKTPENMGMVQHNTTWITREAQRWNANISAVWHDDMPREQQEYLIDLMLNGVSGEPGIFHRDAARRMRPDRRKDSVFLTNPCGEVSLRNQQFCNLTQAVARPWDTPGTLTRKVRLATILGTIQSMATHFPGLRPTWTDNCNEERLLGVDIAGHRDCPLLQSSKLLKELYAVAVTTNAEFARKFGINQSVAVTCAKPGGNSSQFLGVSSGIHPRWSAYYRRNVQIQQKSPLFRLLRDQHVPMSPMLTTDHPTPDTAPTWVIHFPVAAPPEATTRHDLTAIDQFTYWKNVRQNWAEHNPSVTITVRPEERADLRTALLENAALLNGITTLPHSNACYANMPYEEITQEQYIEDDAMFPDIDYTRLPDYEQRDETTSATELSCFAGQCEFST